MTRASVVRDDVIAVLATLALFVVLCLAACTPAQQSRAQTVLDRSLCIQTLINSHLEDDLNDPLVFAALADEIAAKCLELE